MFEPNFLNTRRPLRHPSHLLSRHPSCHPSCQRLYLDNRLELRDKWDNFGNKKYRATTYLKSKKIPKFWVDCHLWSLQDTVLSLHYGHSQAWCWFTYYGRTNLLWPFSYMTSCTRTVIVIAIFILSLWKKSFGRPRPMHFTFMKSYIGPTTIVARAIESLQWLLIFPHSKALLRARRFPHNTRFFTTIRFIRIPRLRFCENIFRKWRKRSLC